MKRIVVGFDHSTGAREALRTALQFARPDADVIDIVIAQEQPVRATYAPPQSPSHEQQHDPERKSVDEGLNSPRIALS